MTQFTWNILEKELHQISLPPWKDLSRYIGGRTSNEIIFEMLQGNYLLNKINYTWFDNIAKFPTHKLIKIDKKLTNECETYVGTFEFLDNEWLHISNLIEDRLWQSFPITLYKDWNSETNIYEFNFRLPKNNVCEIVG